MSVSFKALVLCTTILVIGIFTFCVTFLYHRQSPTEVSAAKTSCERINLEKLPHDQATEVASQCLRRGEFKASEKRGWGF